MNLQYPQIRRKMPAMKPILTAFAFTLLSTSAFATDAGTSQASGNPHISKDSLYNLLIASFARNRGQYSEALDFYLTEANQHPSAYLAEQATRLALHQKRFPDMLDASKLWAATAPEEANAHFFLSLAYNFNQRPAQALEQMRTVLRLGGDTDFTRLANWLDQGSEYTELYRNELQQLYGEYPDSFDLPLALAILNKDPADISQIDNYLHAAVKNADYHPSIIQYAVTLYIQVGQPELALQCYQRAVDNSPDDTSLRQKYAMLASRHDVKTAEEQFLILRDQQPDNDYAIYNLGLIYLETNRLADAEAMFQQLLNMNARANTAIYYLGQIKKFEGRIDDALDYFARIEDDGGEKQLALEATARIQLERGEAGQAQATIETALNMAAQAQLVERLQSLKALTLRKQGKNDEALSFLNNLLQETPDSVELRFSRAMLAEEMNQLQQAEDDLRHILAVEPNSALALNALGYTLADRTTRYPEALELIRQAHELEPDDPAVLDSMGWVLYRLGRYDEALGFLKTAMAKYPDAEVAAHLAEVLWVMGNKEDAAKVLKKALDAAPDHNKLNETIKRLDVPL